MRFLLASVASLYFVFTALAQPVVVGRIPPELQGTFPGAGPQTFVDLAHPANRDGNLTTASLIWSFPPSPGSCTAGFKIKTIRRDTGLFFVMAERGPFPVQEGFSTVTLTPPIPVVAGDFLAVVQLQDSTLCGSVGAANGGPHDMILRYSSSDFATGSFATGGYLNNNTQLMASASSDPEAVAAMLPVVGSVAGIGTFFRTDVQAVNPINMPIKGKFVFHPAGVAPQSSDPSLAYSYAALSTTSIPDIVPVIGSSGLGSLDVIPSSGPAPRLIARVYSDNGAAGTAGFTMDSFAPDQALRRNATYLLVAAADLTAFRMNVGVRSLDDGLTIAISRGTLSVSRSYLANRFEQGTLAAFLGEQPVANGLYRVTIQSGSGFIYTTTTDNRTNDTTIRFLSLGQ
jgi:hypothetical protein